MDPFSAAGTVAGLVALADRIFKLVYTYGKAVRNVRTDVEALADEINTLSTVLRKLEALALDLEAQDDDDDAVLEYDTLGQFKKTLKTIDEKVEVAARDMAGSTRQRFQRQLKWPFSHGETAELLKSLDRHKETVQLALNADTLRSLQLCLSKTAEVGRKVIQIARQMEINTQIALDEKKGEVLDFFMIVNPQPNLQTSTRLRFRTTGSWFLNLREVARWLESSGSHLFLSGMPGAGKTILAGLLVQEALGRSHAATDVGAAFYFCDYKTQKTWGPINILGALLSQLGRQKPEAYSVVEAYHDQLHPSHGLKETPDVEELLAKLVEVAKLFDRVMIVIDGLDECDRLTDKVVENVAGLAISTSNISLAVFSRDHDNIRAPLKAAGFFPVSIEAHTEDIELYVEAELKARTSVGRLRLSTEEMREEIRRTLVEKAKGMFRWVACQLDFLESCADDDDRRDALQKLPPTLPDSYRRLLEQIDRDCSPKLRAKIQLCLAFIAMDMNEPLSIDELRLAVSTPRGNGSGQRLHEGNIISEAEITRRCGSLIRKTANGACFEFAHFSVREFFEDREALVGHDGRHSLLDYHISQNKSRALLAVQSLRYLQLKNFDISPPKSLDMAATDKYGAMYDRAAMEFWVDFLRERDLGEEVHDLVSEALDQAISLFDARKSTYFSRWAEVFISEGVEWDLYRPTFLPPDRRESALNMARETVADERFRPLHLAAAMNVPRLCAVLLEGDQTASYRTTRRYRMGSPLDHALTLGIGIYMRQEDMMRKIEGSHDNGLCKYYWCTGPVHPYGKIGRENLRETLDILLSSGFTISQSFACGPWSMFRLVSSIALEVLFDLYPVLQLLKMSVVPTTSDMSYLSDQLGRFRQTNARVWLDTELEFIASRNDKGSEKWVALQQSGHELLRHLVSPSFIESDWGSQMRSDLWKWAIALGFEFTEDADDIWTAVSPPKDVYADAMAAVQDDDVERIRLLIDGGYLDNFRHGNPEGRDSSLLHEAVVAGALKVFEALIDAGFELNVKTGSGLLPLHWMVGMCPDGLPFLQALKKRSISISTPDGAGRTIWHHWAQRIAAHFIFRRVNSLVDGLLPLSPEETREAMITRDTNGDTPLSTLMKCYRYPETTATEDSDAQELDDHLELNEKFVQLTLELIGICTQLPNFWETHEPIFGLAAKIGSVAIIQNLVQAGAKMDSCDTETRTPLHRLTPRASLDAVKLLRSVFYDACEHRFNGLVPAETYIIKTLEHPHMSLDSGIIRELVTESVIVSRGSSGDSTTTSTLWGSLCDFLGSGKFDQGSIATAILTLLDIGAMEAYESHTGQSGAVSLLAKRWLVYSGSMAHPGAIEDDQLTAACQKAIKASRTWSNYTKDARLVTALKNTVEAWNGPMLKLLLENGISSTQRVDGLSTMEAACEFIREKPCPGLDIAKEVWTELFDSILSKPSCLNETTPDKDGLTLLHRLWDLEGREVVRWLISELEKRGAHVNAVSNGWDLEPISVFNYHLKEGAVQTAALLLDLGADPTQLFTDDYHYLSTSCEAALPNDNVWLLKKLRSHPSVSTSIWQRTGQLSIKISSNWQDLTGANALHLCAWHGSPKCLQFYIDQALLEDVNVTTKELFTPLHVAAAEGEAAVLQELLNRGAKVSVQTDVEKRTPLHLAAISGSLEAVRSLLATGDALETSDLYGKTPRQYAGDPSMIKCFEDHDRARSQIAPSSSTLTRAFSDLGRQAARRLCSIFEAAVKQGDLELCQKLVGQAGKSFLIDAPLPGTNGNTPIGAAIVSGHLDVAKWLVSQGANTLRCYATKLGSASFPILDLVAGRSRMEPLLRPVLQSYLEQGGDLLRGLEIPLHHAVRAGNTKGLDSLIRYIEEFLPLISRNSQLPASEAFVRVLDRLGICGTSRLRMYSGEFAPLHLAAAMEDKIAASILIKKGASVDVRSGIGLSPAILAKTIDMAEYLVGQGASAAGAHIFLCHQIDRGSWSLMAIDLLAWQHSNMFSPKTHRWLKERLVTTSVFGLQRMIAGIPIARPSRLEMDQIVASGLDITATDFSGRSLSHSLISQSGLLNLLIGDDSRPLDRTTPFPWHMYWLDGQNMAFLGTDFKRYKRRLSSDHLRRILNMEPRYGSSPLCQAARTNDVKVIENLLSEGADIDFDGSTLGPAIFVAVFHGCLDAVRLLISHGAAISHYSKEGAEPTSVLDIADYKHIRDWLLVGRFVGLRRLTWASATAPDQVHGHGDSLAESLCLWSGIVQLAHNLVQLEARRWNESTLEHVRRLSVWKKSIQGRVISARTDSLVFPEVGMTALE